MKKRLRFLIITTLILFSFVIRLNYNTTAYADAMEVYLGGMTAGFTVSSEGAYVVGLCDVVTNNGIKSPAKDADIVIGDVILKIDNNIVNSALDIEQNICKNEIIVQIKRKNDIIDKKVNPVVDMSGNYKLGVFIRDGVSGIGTITYIKDGKFASLGHPILNEDNEILTINKGNIYNCNITSLIKGEKGKAGELKGVFLRSNSIGRIEKNLNSGVYGSISSDFSIENLKKIQIGKAEIGSAKIISTINGCTPNEYSISIIKCDNNQEVKNLVIKITDEKLLSETNGILQGMSGSPIVQNNKLVGAITHVFINDPSRGFGISIENMINN